MFFNDSQNSKYNCNLQSRGQIMCIVPWTRTVFGESAFKVYLQNHLQLHLSSYKNRIKDYLTAECTRPVTEHW